MNVRKLRPAALMTVRDGFVIFKDNKFIANHNIYNLDGELLTPSGYPISRFTSGNPVVGEHQASANTGLIQGGLLLAESGRTAEANKAWTEDRFSGGNRGTTYDGGFGHTLIGVDGILPAVTRMAKGESAGQYLVRHPSGYMDVTSDVAPTVLESDQLVQSTVSGVGTPGGAAQYTQASRIIGESDSAVVALMVQGATTMNTTVSGQFFAGVYTKSFSYKTKGMTPASSFVGPTFPLYHNKDRNLFLFLYYPTTPAVYGTTPMQVRPYSLRHDPITLDTINKAGTQRPLDRYPSAAYSPISAAGYLSKNLAYPRALIEEEAGVTVFVPEIKATDGNNVNSVSLARHTYNYELDAWSHVQVTILDEQSLQPIVFNEFDLDLPNGSWTSIANSVTQQGACVFNDLSFVQTVAGETYVIAIRTPGSAVSRATIRLPTNTLQYTFKLDKQDPTKAYLVKRDVYKGFFGRVGDTLHSFAGNSDYSNVYAICNNDVARLRFNPTSLQYELDPTVIDVNAVSLLVTPEENLWIIDERFKLYTLKANNADTVRVSFDENANQQYEDAAYDMIVKVSCVNHLGQRASRTVELVVEGPAAFKSNNRNKVSVLTSETDDVSVLVNVKSFGNIYVTPTSVT